MVPFQTPAGNAIQETVGDHILDLSRGVEDEGQVDLGSEIYLDLPEKNVVTAYKTYRNSPHLVRFIDALEVNVYGTDFRVVPFLNLKKPADKDKVKDSLELDMVGEDFEEEAEVSEEEFKATLLRITRRQARERMWLEGFFRRCFMNTTLLRGKIKLGQDLEIIGNGYYEVLRDKDNKPSRFQWLPGWSIRACPLEKTLIAYDRPYRRNAIRWQREKQYRRFRKYIQLSATGSQVIGRFKEYGDPRFLSRTTGKYYETLEALEEAESKEGENGEIIKPKPATEILHWDLPFAESSVYGRGKWSPMWPGLTGNRELDELNMRVVTDQEIPQMIMAIMGGRGGSMAAEIERMQKAMADQKEKGGRGIYYIHAYDDRKGPQGPTTVPTVHFEKTKDIQHDDALGLKYQEYVANLARLTYRFSRMSLGDDEGLNMKTAMLSLRQTEEQVHDPRRDLVLDIWNEKILPDLGIETCRLEAMSRAPKDPRELAEITKMLAEIGLTPDECREIAAEILNKDYNELEGAWSRIPKNVLTAVLQTKNHLTGAAILSPEQDFMKALADALRAEFGKVGAPLKEKTSDEVDETDSSSELALTPSQF